MVLSTSDKRLGVSRKRDFLVWDSNTFGRTLRNFAILTLDSWYSVIYSPTSSQGRSLWEFPKAKTYIWPYILSWVLIKKLYKSYKNLIKFCFDPKNRIILPRGYISQYDPYGKCWIFSILENTANIFFTPLNIILIKNLY